MGLRPLPHRHLSFKLSGGEFGASACLRGEKRLSIASKRLLESFLVAYEGLERRRTGLNVCFHGSGRTSDCAALVSRLVDFNFDVL